ncbi:MAG: Paraquat-inducible protein B [uncultured Paraburkholderia sp.]|nr:MAG: Paraquat-inducible protein B [uncultured Paraburkholderia sp.]
MHIPDLPHPEIKPRSRWLPSLVWLIPLISALIGIALLVKSVTAEGPIVTVTFNSAEGLEAGKTKVRYKDVEIGAVRTIALTDDLRQVRVQIQFDKAAAKFATEGSRFWVVRPRIGASGISGLGTLLSGAYIGADIGRSPRRRTDFTGLETPPIVTADQQGHQYTLRGESLGSLDIGAPVDLRGITLGQVTKIGLEYDEKALNFSMEVTMALYPDRLSRRSNTMLPAPNTQGANDLLQHLVMHGLRGQLRTGNLLTGQLYVALDMFPQAPRATVDLHNTPIDLPTVPNTLDELQLQIAGIARKLNQVPFDKIGANLSGTLENANRLFGQLNTEVVPQARSTLASAQKTFDAAQATLGQDSPMQADVHGAMRELTRTLQSLNALADYLERHPEALVFGKKGDRQ